MGEPDHKRKSRTAFDRQAAQYDTEMYGRHARRLHGEVMAAVERFEFGAVLDVGCGTGATLEAIVSAQTGVHACGIDLSPEMIAVSRPGGGLVIGEWRLVTPWRQLMNRLLPRMPEGDVRIYTGRELTDLAEAAGYRVERCAPAGVRGQLLVARR